LRLAYVGKPRAVGRNTFGGNYMQLMLNGRRPTPRIKPTPIKSMPNKVTGFLLVICIFLTIIQPLFFFYTFQSTVIDIHELNTQNLEYLIFLGIDILMVLFSVLSGLLLWLRKRLGLNLSKIFLVFSLIVGVLVVAYSLSLNIQNISLSNTDGLSSFTYLIFWRTIIPFLILLYLFRSKYVQVLYSKSTASNSGFPSGG